MFSEMRRTALLLCDGISGDDIVQLSLEKNIYQLDKEKRRRDVPRRMLKRLAAIGQPSCVDEQHPKGTTSSLVEIIAKGHDSDAKLIAFFALMKSDRLLYEYMYEVYSDSFRAGRDEIDDKEFLDFIERKAQNDDAVAKWSASNLAAIRGKIKSTLCEAGLAKRTKTGLLIQIPLIAKEFLHYISDSDRAYASAMLMEV